MRVTELLETVGDIPSMDDIQSMIHQFDHHSANLERHDRKRGMEIQFQDVKQRANYLHFHPWLSGSGIEKSHPDEHKGLESRLKKMTSITQYFTKLNIHELGDDEVNLLWKWAWSTYRQLYKALFKMELNFPSDFHFHMMDGSPLPGQYNAKSGMWTPDGNKFWDEVGRLSDGGIAVFVFRQNYTDKSIPTKRDVDDFKEAVKLAQSVEDFYNALNSLG